MEWYWWLLIGWVLSAFLAMGMHIRDNPKLQENVGVDDAWPMVFGPAFLFVKLCQWLTAGSAR